MMNEEEDEAASQRKNKRKKEERLLMMWPWGVTLLGPDSVKELRRSIVIFKVVRYFSRILYVLYYLYINVFFLLLIIFLERAVPFGLFLCCFVWCGSRQRILGSFAIGHRQIRRLEFDHTINKRIRRLQSRLSQNLFSPYPSVSFYLSHSKMDLNVRERHVIYF